MSLASKRVNPNADKLYRTIWRWHFYAGLLCIPFIISLSVTGAIYLFKPQIDNWIDRSYQNLPTSPNRTTPSEQIAAALNAKPNASFASYRLPETDTQAIVITVKEKGVASLVYVNPFTLNVLKVVKKNDQFIRIIRALHGELLLGNVGSIIIELSGCWAIVMIITGLYLWWPRNASGFAGLIYPRLMQGRRKFWRDLHAVTGFWVAFFTLFLLISGLPWALVWGSAFKEIRSLGQPVAVQQDWEVNQQPQMKIPIDWSRSLTPLLLQKAQDLKFNPPLELGPDRHNPKQWKLSSGHQNRMLRADAWFNANTGELIRTKPFSERKALDKAIGIGIAAHEGHLFGVANQILGLVVTLALILVSITGFILWRKRKPTGILGAPPPMPNVKIAKMIFIIILILAALLPVLALSLLALLCVEKLILQRINPVKNWLGLA